MFVNTTQVAEEVFFLRLPFKIRRQIYVKLGLFWSSDIDLSDTQSGGEWSARYQRLRNRDGLANQLFYVSHAVSEDARAMLYSENKFWVSDQVGCGLRILMNLSPLAWTSLRCISIRLGTSTCGGLDQGCHDPIDGRFEWNPEAISNWVQICAQLATYIKQDDQLDLRLVCSAASKETAAAFLDPLRSLPRLRACSIRLGPYWNPTLQEMIMTTIQQTTKYFPTQPSATFRFPNLPLEIQLRILEYSGLVTSIPVVYKPPWNKFIPEDCRRFWCNARPHAYLLCQGCYCSSTHTAFSTAYPCLGIPDALFLVSTMMRQLAASIFYSKNILRVPVDLSNLPIENYPTGAAWCPQTSLFLSPFPEHSWQHLRYIRWEFPNLDVQAFQPNSQETEDWANTVIFIFQKLNPTKLTLELDLSCWDWFLGDLASPDRIAMNWGLCNRVIEPVTCLRGLQDFFVHILGPLAPPNDWIRVGKEQILEQRVMGGDYDSLARGKEHKQVNEC